MNLVITGTSSGIGRALAEHLLQSGHQVWGLARSGQSALSSEFSARFHPVRCDVSDWAQVAAAARDIHAVAPHLDGLVTCAGLQGAVGAAVTLDPLQWSATVRVNLDGTFYAVRAFHELLSRCPRRAKVVCFSGGGATKARPNFSAYGAAKTAVVRLVETLAEELHDEPLDVNAIAPGAIPTRLTEEVLRLGPAVVGEAEYQAALKQKSPADGAPLARALQLVEFLLSPASDGLSGRLLSAPWDPWEKLSAHAADLGPTDIYMLRRVLPEDRGKNFS
ncbi:MAG TPA: SDR family oxidoreductase [Opitutaceae bacterium]|nr:SDR family oxidoreductase [Opitutaceae bacterium]